MTDSPETPAEDLENAITEAVGWELRRVREERGWSRAQFVKRLPSGIGDRTLLAYEHGLRQLTVSRLLELAQALDIDAAAVLRRGLQRARLYLESLTLDVDLHMLLNDCGSGRSTFRPMAQWARNALNESPAGTAESSRQSYGTSHSSSAAHTGTLPSTWPSSRLRQTRALTNTTRNISAGRAA